MADNRKNLLFPKTAPETLWEKPQNFGDFVINNLYWMPSAEKNEEVGGKDMTPKNALVISTLDKSVTGSVKSTLINGLTQTNMVKGSREKTEQFIGSVKNIFVVNRTSAIAANFVNKEILHFKALDFQNITENYHKHIDLFGFTDAQQIFRLSNGSVTNSDKPFFADIGVNSAAPVYRELIFGDRTTKEIRESDLTAKEPRELDQAAKEPRKLDQATKEPSGLNQAAKEPRELDQTAKESRKLDQAAKELHESDQTTKGSHKSDRTIMETHTTSGNLQKTISVALSKLIRLNTYFLTDSGLSQMSDISSSDSPETTYNERLRASLHEGERSAHTISAGSDKFPDSVSRKASDGAGNSRNPGDKKRSSLFERILEIVFSHQRNTSDHTEVSGHSKVSRPSRPAYTKRSDSPLLPVKYTEHTDGKSIAKVGNSVSKSHITSTADIQVIQEQPGKFSAPKYGEPAQIRKFAFNIQGNFSNTGIYDADTRYFRINASIFFGGIQAEKKAKIPDEALKNDTEDKNHFSTAEFILFNSYHSESAKTYADFAAEQRYGYDASEYVYGHDVGNSQNPDANSISRSFRNSLVNLLHNRVYENYFKLGGMSDSLSQEISVIKTDLSSSFKKETREFYDKGTIYTSIRKFSQIPYYSGILPGENSGNAAVIKSDHPDRKRMTLLFAAGIYRRELFGILSNAKDSEPTYIGFHADHTNKREPSELRLLHNFTDVQIHNASAKQAPKALEQIWIKSSVGSASISNIIKLSSGNSISVKESESVRGSFSSPEEHGYNNPQIYRQTVLKNSIIRLVLGDHETISSKHGFNSPVAFVRELAQSFSDERATVYLSGIDRGFNVSNEWKEGTKAFVLKSLRNMNEAEVRLFFTEQNRLVKKIELESDTSRYLNKAEYSGSEALSFYGAAQREYAADTGGIRSEESLPKINPDAENPERSGELVLAITKSNSEYAQTPDTPGEPNKNIEQIAMPKAEEIYKHLNISESIRALLSSEEAMKSYIYSRINSYISEAKSRGEDSAADINRNTEIICERVFTRLEQRLKTERRLNGR